MSISQFPETLMMTKVKSHDEEDAVDPSETRPLLGPETPSPPQEAESSADAHKRSCPKLYSDDLNDVDAILPIDGDAPGLHILVAEYDPVTRSNLKARLEQLGHDVCVVANGRDCADMYRAELFDGNLCPFDVALVGITMEIVNGFRAARIIRETERQESAATPFGISVAQRRVPIFAIAGTLNENSRQYYIDLGFDGWILKPIDYDRLEVLIKSVQEDELRDQNIYAPGMWHQGGWFKRKGEDSGEPQPRRWHESLI